MSLSNIAIAEREKETKQLNTFLVYSLIGSLILHIGLITLSISKFLFKPPEIKDKPIEFTLLEEIPKPQPKSLIKTKFNQKSEKANSSSGGNNGNGKIAVKTKINNVAKNVAKSPTTDINKQPIIPRSAYFTPQKIPKSIITKNTTKITTRNIVKPAIKSDPIISKSITKPEIKPIIEPKTSTIIKPQIEPEIEPIVEPTTSTIIKPQTMITREPNIQPVVKPVVDEKTTKIPSSKLPNYENITSSISTQLPGNSFNDDDKLGNSGTSGFTKGSGNTTGNGTGNTTGNGTGNTTGNGTGNTTGNGTGNTTGNGTGNNKKKDKKPIITPLKPPSEIGTKLNRADCIRCDIKYPDRARRRAIEGNVQVAIDVDANGNIIRVELIDSSGDSELDEAAQIAVKEWKLKPLPGGRQGIIAAVKFKMKK